MFDAPIVPAIECADCLAPMPADDRAARRQFLCVPCWERSRVTGKPKEAEIMPIANQQTSVHCAAPGCGAPASPTGKTGLCRACAASAGRKKARPQVAALQPAPAPAPAAPDVVEWLMDHYLAATDWQAMPRTLKLRVVDLVRAESAVAQ